MIDAEQYLLGIFFACLGAIVGSYLNVVLLRYNTGRSSGGRSSCMSCLRELQWYELFPVLSFIFLRGRCRTCTSRLSFQYPAVEAALALLFFLTYLKESSLIETLFVMVVSTLLLFITVYDLKHLIIPRGPMYALLALSVASLFVETSPFSFRVPEMLDVVMGPSLFLFFALLYVASKGRAVGFGDAKLSLAIGLLLGYPGGLSAFMLAFWIGALVGLALLGSRYIPRTLAVLSRMGKVSSGKASAGVYFSYDESSHWSGKSEVPFAPFLALGVFLVYFFNVSVFPLF